MGLFSTTHIHRTTVEGGGPSHVTVVEKKAPTDESVKLLNQMEEKARNNIIEKIHIQNTIVDAVAISFIYLPQMDFEEYHLKFKINGREIVVREKVSGSDFIKLEEYANQSLFKHITHAVMTEVAKAINQK